MNGIAVRPIVFSEWRSWDKRRTESMSPPHGGVYLLAHCNSGASVGTAWRAACRRAGVAGLRMHDLRREAGSRWVDTGVPLHLVQRWLGHANTSQTSTYLQADSSSARTQAAMREHEARWAALHPVCIDAEKTTSASEETGSDPAERKEYAGKTQEHATH